MQSHRDRAGRTRRLAPIFGVLVPVVGCVIAPLAGQEPSQPPTHHSDMSIAFRFGTLGLGLEAARLLTSHVSVRLGGSYFSYSVTHTESGINYAASLKLHDFAGLIDLYPGARGSLHLTTGIVTNPLTISATGQAAADSFMIHHKNYSSSQVGTLTADAKFKAGPYLGLGFGTPANYGSALKFAFDLGVVLGKPSVSLNATGTACAAGTTCGNDLQAQQATTQHDLRKVKVYPVLLLGLAYRF